MIDNEKFERARQKVMSLNRERNGIGTLQEKTIHAVLKNYYEEDADRQEIPIDAFVADIYNGREIIEIQTAQFNKIREKLCCFLPAYEVTIVHPVPRYKYIVWIDKETGEHSARRKSNVTGNPYFIFPELYKIKQYLLNDNLHIKIVMLDMEELRFLNKSPKRRKKSAGKIDRFPITMVDEVSIAQREDYMQFVPYSLGDEFTSEEFAREAHIQRQLAQITLNILHYVGTIEKVGKRGNSILYMVKD